MPELSLHRSWSLDKAGSVATLYESAFGPKFTVAVPERSKRIEILQRSFSPEFSFVVCDADVVVGLAGFKNDRGSLTGALGLRGLIDVLGVFSGIRAAILFSVLERKPVPDELVMDGIVVDERYRGKGIGSRLLDAVLGFAAKNGFKQVRLDVIDSNPRARKLYEQKGFEATDSFSLPALKKIVGFSGVTTMIYRFK